MNGNKFKFLNHNYSIKYMIFDPVIGFINDPSILIEISLGLYDYFVGRRMYMYMHSSTDRVRQVNGAPTQQSHYTECLNIYKGREGRGELVIHSLYTEKRTLSPFLSLSPSYNCYINAL